MIDSYFVCATPRTGSSLLLGLLESTGVAGHPEAYFRAPDEQSWAERWQLSTEPLDYRQFVRAARAAGSTPNGVFGAKLMWGALEEVTAKLGGDLEAAFGQTRFVYLRREDTLAQAVSWLRAEQTSFWYVGDVNGNGREPAYDEEGIRFWLETIEGHNVAWREWFAAAGVVPHEVRYEDLTADLVGVTRGILEFLGLELPAGQVIKPRHQRQADAVSREWIARYRASAAGRSGLG